MTPRRAQRRLRRYADHPIGPTWRDLDGARLWDDPQWSPPRYDASARKALKPRPPYEQMPQRPALSPRTITKTNEPKDNAA